LVSRRLFEKRCERGKEEGEMGWKSVSDFASFYWNGLEISGTGNKRFTLIYDYYNKDFAYLAQHGTTPNFCKYFAGSRVPAY
jgi:hypothetical protein